MCFYLNLQAIWDWIILCLTFYTAIMVNFTIMWIEMILQICFNIRQIIPIHHPKLSSQVPFNVALKNKTSEDVSLLVIDSIVDGNWTSSLSPTDRWPLSAKVLVFAEHCTICCRFAVLFSCLCQIMNISCLHNCFLHTKSSSYIFHQKHYE